MTYNKTLRLPRLQYFSREYPKDLIVLHFTAGQSARSAYDSWINSPLEVATAYIIDTDGKIYETFDPSHWAYHLGIPGTASANHKHDKRSIGIEIVNVGPLKKKGAYLNWWPNNYGATWCLESETSKYVATPYRGFQYFAPFQEAQYAAVLALVTDLCQRFKIVPAIPPPDKRTACDLDFFAKYSGIASHQNFRNDKFDVGPAFDWSKIV